MYILFLRLLNVSYIIWRNKISYNQIRFTCCHHELKFEKPGRRDNFDYPDMAKEAVTKALKDANIDYSQIKQAAVGYVYGKKDLLHLEICAFAISKSFT